MELMMKKLMALMTVLLAVTAPKAAQAFDDFCCGGFQGVYVSAFGGASFPETKHCNKLKTGYVFSGALGYRFCDGLRAEIEGGYHHNSKKSHHDRRSSSSSSSFTNGNNGDSSTSSSSSNRHHRCRNNHGGDANTWAVLVNGIYDFETCWCLKPFLGAGIGYSSTKFKHGHRRHGRHDSSSSSSGCEVGCGHSSSSSSSSHGHHREKTGFAWQLIAGVAYPLCDGWDVSLQYRYFNPAEKTKLHNHDVGVGLAYTF